jgi:hypothetical protein
MSKGDRALAPTVFACPKAPLFIFKEGWIAQIEMLPLKGARRGDFMRLNMPYRHR